MLLPVRAPKFLVLERQRVRASSWVLAVVVAACVGALLAVGLRHTRHRHFRENDAARRSGSAGQSAGKDDDDDDPNQVDVIALGDAADAPMPHRRSDHVSSVHPTILVRLPRFGPEEGLIPSSPAGHLLYGWLAAFNQANEESMEAVLPGGGATAQMELREATGGYRLLSAREAAPGVLVFRLRDQTPEGNEALGTLVMRPGSDPAAISSLSLRAALAGK